MKNRTHPKPRAPLATRIDSLLSAATTARVLSTALAFGLATLRTQGNPIDGRVTAGDVGMQQDGAVLTIEQKSQRAIVEWKDFSIEKGEHTRFLQPSRDAAILNRVVGKDASRLDGRLTADGHVYLLNPNGIVVGPSGTIDAHSFVASTLDLPDDAFMAGGTLEFRGDSEATIVNLGRISAAGGDVILMAREVSNEGTIEAPGGLVGLAAGSEVLLFEKGDERLAVRAGTGAVSNSGAIAAATAELKAAGGNRYVLAINQTGVIRATTVERQGGRVLLKANTGVVQQAGTIDASGSASGTRGGRVRIVGEKIALTAGSVIDASGPAGGGTVEVGGGINGENPDIPNATAVVMAPTARIAADATESGDGGTVVLWSEEFTNFQGIITARGGPLGGAGGFIETSSRLNLQAFGWADASATKGTPGRWLLDPRDVTITAATGGGTFDGSDPNTFIPTNDGATIDVATINASLNAGTSVTVTTGTTGSQDGNITLAANTAVTKAAGGNATLRLEAANSIFLLSGSSITSSSGQLSVVLNADRDGSGAGAIELTSATITTNGGNIVMGGSADPLTGSAFGTAANPSGILLFGSLLSSGAGFVALRGTGFGSGSNPTPGIQLQNATSVTSTSGSISLIGFGGASNNASTGVLFGSGGATVATGSGAITLTGTGGSGSAQYSAGVRLDADNSIVEATGTGTISITGTGGANSQWGHGVLIGSGANSRVRTGSGSLSISGTALSGTSGTYGTVAAWGGVIETGSGALTIAGFAPAGAAAAVGSQSTNPIRTTTGGSITLRGDTVELQGTLSGAGPLTIEPTTATTTIGLGNSATGTLNLDAGELANLSNGFSSITIGSATGSGAVDVRTAAFNDPVTIRTPSGSGSITLNGALSTGSGTSSGSITVQAGDSIIGNSGASITTQGQAITLNSDRDASGAGAISLTGSTLTSNGGDITLGGGANPTTTAAFGTATYRRGISIGVGTNITTAGGAFSARGTSGTAAATDYGIVVQTASIATGTGSLALIGQASPGSTTNNSYGVVVWNGSTLSATGTGTITVTGTGAAQSNGAVWIANTNVSTVDGDVSVSGSGAAGGSAAAVGVWLEGTNTIAATGLGNIAITGSSAGSGANAHGVSLSSDYTAGVTTLRTASGQLSVNGTGTGSSAGVRISNGSVVEGTGTGGISITAVASAGANALSITGAATIGDGPAAGAFSGPLTLTADSANLAGTISGTGSLSIQPVSAGTTIGLGNSATGMLNLNAAELATLQNGFSSITIGRADGSGAVDVRTAAFNDPMTIRTPAGSGSITLNGDLATGSGTSAGSITLEAGNSVILNNSIDPTPSITTQGQAITVYSDRDASGVGAIELWNARVASTSGDITLTAATMIVAGGSIASSGALFIQPSTASSTIGLGNSATGTLNLDATTELAAIQDGFSSITIGRADGSGAVVVRTAAFNDPVTIRTPAGSGSITLNGALSTGSGTSSGSITLVAAGALTGAAGSSITTQNAAINLTGAPVSGAMDIASNGGLITINHTGSGTISGNLTGTGSGLTLNGGTLILTGANTYTGTTTINTGTLQPTINASQTGLGSGNVSIGASGTLAFNNTGTSADVTIPNTISGSGAMSIAFASGGAARNTYLNNASAFTGNISLSTPTTTFDKLTVITTTPQGWTVNVGANTTFYTGTGNLTVAGVTVQGTGNSEGLGALRVDGGLTLTSNITLSGNATFGSQFVSGGVINGTISNASGSAATLTLGAGFTLNGNISNGTNPLALTMSRSGATTTLAGNNTYTGTTAINAGTLIAAANSTQTGLGTGAVTIASGATFRLDNLNTTSSNVNVANAFSGSGTLNVQFATGGSARNTIFSNLSGFSGLLSLTTATTTADKVFFTGSGPQAWALNIASNTTFMANASATIGAGITVIGSGNTEGYGAIRVDSGRVLGGTITLAGNARIGNGGAISGAISNGSGSAATLTLSSGMTMTGDISDGTAPLSVEMNAPGLISTLSGNNTYTGSTHVAAGTLRAGSTSAFGNNSAATVSGTLDLGGFSNTIGSLAGAGTVTNSGATAATLTAGGSNASTTFSGSLQNGTGGISFTKAGSGTLTLTNQNTFTGGTTVSAGTLRLAATQLAPGTTAVASGATLELNAASNVVQTNVATITGSGQVVKTGSGTFTVGNGTTFPNAVLTLNMGAGALVDVQAGALYSSSYGLRVNSGNLASLNIATGALFYGDGGTAGDLYFDALTGGGSIPRPFANQTLFLGQNNGSGTFSGVLNSASGGGGTLSIVKNGSGTQTFSGANTYTGTTTVNAGTLTLARSNTSGSAGNVLPVTNSIIVNSGGTLAFGANDNWGNHLTAASSAIVVNAGGTVTSNGYYNTIWNLTLNGGTLNANGGANADFGSFGLAGTVTVTGTAQVLASGTNSQINLGSAGTTTTTFHIVNPGDSLTVAPVLQSFANLPSNNTALTKTGSGTLTLAATNTYTGGTTVNAGTLQVGDGGTTGTLGAGAVTNNGSLVFHRSNNLTVANDISGTGSVAQSGSGILNLAGANTFGGTTSVNAGTLTLSGSWNRSGATAAIAVAAGATLNGTGLVTASTLNVSGLGTVSLTGNNAVNTLAGTGTTGALTFFNNAPLAVNAITASGAITLQTAPTFDLTLNQPISSSAAGDAIVLASGDDFFNSAGASAVMTSNGRFLVYSSDWTEDVTGGLSTGRLYNRTFAANPPGTITQPGSQFLYSRQPTLTLTALDAAREYGDANPTFGVLISGLVNGDPAASVFSGAPTATTLATQASGIGTYAITPGPGTMTLTDQGYAVAFVPGTLTINRALLTIDVDDQLRVYGDANPTLTAVVTGFKNGEDASVISGLSLSTLATQGTGIGSYAISASGANASNYSFAYNPGTLTIDPAPLVIRANDKSRLYGAANPVFTATFTGLKNGETASVVSGLSLSSVATAASPVGPYAIVPSGAVAANYAITFEDGTLTVANTTLRMIVDNKTRLFGQDNPAFTITYSGFVNGDDASLVQNLVLETSATNRSNVGRMSSISSMHRCRGTRSSLSRARSRSIARRWSSG